MDLSVVLYENLGIVLTKFFETYEKIYDPLVVSDAVSNAIVLLSQAHLSYLCEVSQEGESELRENLLKFVNWQHQINLEIFNEFLPSEEVDDESPRD